MEKYFLHKTWVHIFLIILLGIIVYSNTIYVPFIFDDIVNIVEKREIKDSSIYLAPLKGEGFGKARGIQRRYAGSLTFALNYELHGLDVAGYHILNLLVHIVNAILVYSLVVLTFSTPLLRQAGSGELRRSKLIAFFAALFFISHPLQTQAVTYIVQRFTSLAAMFYLFSLVMYVKARLALIEGDKTLYPRVRRILLYGLSLLFAVFAMMTKEIAFTLPLIVCLYEFMFFRGNIGKRILYLSLVALTILIVPISILGVDKPFEDLAVILSEETIVESNLSRLDYMFTQFRVIVTYIRLVFLPVNQNLDYDYPLYHSFFDIGVFSSFLLLMSIFGLAMYFFYRCRNSVPQARLITFGVLWFFITLSVESSFIPIIDVINEHRMYLPSIGIFIVLVTGFFLFAEKARERWRNMETVIISCAAIIVLTLSAAAYARNGVWQSGIVLWEDVVSKSPGKHRAHYNLAFEYEASGLIDKAINHYQSAVRIKPAYFQAHENLSHAYAGKGMASKAAEHLQIASKIRSSFSEDFNNTGKLYFSKGRIDKAIGQFHIALKFNYSSPDVHNNLGIAYQKKGHVNGAITEFKFASRFSPGWTDPRLNLGRIYFERGYINRAREQFERLLQIDPQHDEAKQLLLSIYRLEGRKNGALK